MEIIKPGTGGHAGAQLAGWVRVIQTTSSPMQNPTRLVVTSGEQTFLDTNTFYFTQNPEYPDATVSDHGFMWPAHMKASPGTYAVTATLTYFVMMGPPPGGGYQGTIVVAQEFDLDNYTPTFPDASTPGDPALGFCGIGADVVPAAKAGAGVIDDFIDAVLYTAGDASGHLFSQWLTKQDGHYENGQWVPTPYRWAGSWDTAEQWGPENSGPADWGEPRYPDGAWACRVEAHFGPNAKVSVPDKEFSIENQGSLAGVVKDQVTGLPVAGAIVEAARYWPNQLRKVYGTATTNAQGEWHIPLYPAGYSIEVREVNYVTGVVSRGLAPRQHVTGIEILLDRRVVVDFPGMPPMMMGGWPADGFTPAHARATVRNQDGTPAPNGTQVTFSTTYGRLEPATATTTIDGEGQARATVDLIPDPRNETDVTAEVTAQADGNGPDTCHLPPVTCHLSPGDRRLRGRSDHRTTSRPTPRPKRTPARTSRGWCMPQ